MRRILITLCIAWCLLLSNQLTALSEECYDYRTDSRSFFGIISGMNAQINDNTDAKGNEKPQVTMVLFQTNGTIVDFESAPFDVISIAYGPEGLSALLSTEPEAAVVWLRTQENVLFAEIDTEVSGCSESETPKETVFQSWAADSLGFGAYLAYAKQWGTGSATVAVIDSGTFPHSLISQRMRIGGHDYIDNDDDSTNDLNGHGTRVAGIVADCTRDLPVYIYPIRVLDADANGRTSNVICAVLEAKEAHVDVINLSLATFSVSELLQNAIRSAISSGITVVAAAGNYACDTSEVTPACMRDEGIIVVGSADANGMRSSFSNYGESVDVYVYGRNISSCSRSGGYVTDTGTSMAAPHMAGLCAMMKLIHPSISASSMDQRIKRTITDDTGIPSAAAMVPQRLGFRLNAITLRTGDTLTLRAAAIPDSSLETIQYISSNPAVVEAVDGLLSAKAAGEAVITVSCKGIEETSIDVTVADGAPRSMTLPSDLTAIEDEAFLGICTDRIVLPYGLQTIGNHAFDQGSVWYILIPETVCDIGNNSFSEAVIICKENSAAHHCAEEHQYQYITLEQ